MENKLKNIEYFLKREEEHISESGDELNDILNKITDLTAFYLVKESYSKKETSKKPLIQNHKN